MGILSSMPQDAHTMLMTSALSPNLPMQRDGSGTSWLPDSTHMHAFHLRAKAWSLMLHGKMSLRYTNQDVGKKGTRGGSKFDAPNVFMVMGKRSLGVNNQLTLRGMFSFDRLTEGGNGYPLLFQTGETWEGERLIDRQHPHDFFGELSITYSYSMSGDTDLFVYFGLPGEPALGPPVYLHRPSSENNPDAPLGHHWQDATHITFGVLTAGWRYKQFKLDGSLFTGREPDENRFNIDKPRFDSYSIRLSWNPTERTAMQVSHGFLKSPESLEPEHDLWRTTASLIYNRPINRESNWATTIVWGMNKPIDEDAQHSLLGESELQIKDTFFYTRVEFIQKPAVDLGLVSEEHRLFLVRTFTLGAARNIITAGNMYLALGAQGTVYGVEEDLQSLYGTRPFSLGIFLRLSPGILKMEKPAVREHGMMRHSHHPADNHVVW